MITNFNHRQSMHGLDSIHVHDMMMPTFWPRNPKFNRDHLLVMTNNHTKLEDPWAMSSLVIDRTRFVYRRTDQPTCAKQYKLSSSKGHNYVFQGPHYNLMSIYQMCILHFIKNKVTYILTTHKFIRVITTIIVPITYPVQS